MFSFLTFLKTTCSQCQEVTGLLGRKWSEVFHSHGIAGVWMAFSSQHLLSAFHINKDCVWVTAWLCRRSVSHTENKTQTHECSQDKKLEHILANTCQLQTKSDALSTKADKFIWWLKIFFLFFSMANIWFIHCVMSLLFKQQHVFVDAFFLRLCPWW